MRELRDDPSMLSKRGSDEAETAICIGRVRFCAADADEDKSAGGTSSCATAISAGSNSMSATAARIGRLAPTLERPIRFAATAFMTYLQR